MAHVQKWTPREEHDRAKRILGEAVHFRDAHVGKAVMVPLGLMEELVGLAVENEDRARLACQAWQESVRKTLEANHE